MRKPIAAQESSAAPEFRFLGTRVHGVTAEQLGDSIVQAAVDSRRLMIGHHNMHSLALVQDDPAMQSFYERCDLVFADGMAVVMLGRLLGEPLTRRHRMTSLDYLEDILKRLAAADVEVFYLGSAAETVERAAAVLRQRVPGLRLKVRNGYFDHATGSSSSKAVCEEINASDASVLIVGMGMPVQERWLVGHHDSLRPAVLLTIGAYADYIAGAIPVPPRWAGKMGLEWLFRLLAEPRRLAQRYLFEPWRLVRPLWRDVWLRRQRRLSRPR